MPPKTKKSTPPTVSGRAASSCSSIGVYPRYPDHEIKRCIDDVRDRLPDWFAENPKRKICKVDLFYGRSVDLRRDNYSERLDKELSRFLQKNALFSKLKIYDTEKNKNTGTIQESRNWTIRKRP